VRRNTLFWISSLLGALPALPAPAQDVLVLRAGKILVAPGKVLPRGTMVVREGKVFALGRDLATPAGAKELDFPTAVVVPGWVDSWTQATSAGETQELSTAWTPEIRAADALDLESPLWERFARWGVTSVVVTPDPAQVGGGLACLVKTGRKARLVEKALFLQFSLTSRARNRERPPTSLAGQVALIRRNFRKAPKEGPLARALSGKLPALFACRTPAEVQAALRLAAEFHLPKVLLEAPQACRPLPSLLEGSGVGLILTPPGKEAPPWSLGIPAALAGKGLPFAFASACPSYPPVELRLLPAPARRRGLDPVRALAAVTVTPARLLDLSWRIGSLRLGRDADFLVLDGPPAHPGSRILSVFVEGRPVWTAPAGAAKESPK